MIKPTRNPVTQNADQHGYLATDYDDQDKEGNLNRRVDIPFPSKQINTYNAGACGNMSEVTSLTGKTRIRGCHFNKLTANGKKKEGDKWGEMGHTGFTIPEGEAGTHLHIIMWRKVLGVWVRRNPNRWLNRRLRAIRKQKEVVRKAQAKLKRLEEC